MAKKIVRIDDLETGITLETAEEIKPDKVEKKQDMKPVYYDALKEVKKMIKQGKHPETVIRYIDSVV